MYTHSGIYIYTYMYLCIYLYMYIYIYTYICIYYCMALDFMSVTTCGCWRSRTTTMRTITEEMPVLTKSPEAATHICRQSCIHIYLYICIHLYNIYTYAHICMYI